jgi:hypothetical protein
VVVAVLLSKVCATDMVISCDRVKLNLLAPRLAS